MIVDVRRGTQTLLLEDYFLLYVILIIFDKV
jgi:hypothetical protein